MPVTIAALGTVAPLAVATVKTQISGQLQQIAFKEGQMVRKGDFLAQIDARPYENTLAQAQGTQARDQALLQNANLDLQRYKDLLTEGSIAKQQLDTQQALVQQLEATAATDAALVNAARLNLQYTHIVAPISGRVGLRQVDIGNYVTAGDANGIVVIAQLQPITVLFPVPEDNIPALMKRLHDGATLPVTALNRDDSKTLASGVLTTVDNEMDTTTGTVKLRAQLDNQDESLFPNQFVNVHLLVDTLRNRVIVPTSAIQHGTVEGAAGTFVFLVNPDSTVAVRAVTLGASDGERVAIATGLAAGDVVVTEGGDRLRDGARVLLHDAAAAAAEGLAPPALLARTPDAARMTAARVVSVATAPAALAHRAAIDQAGNEPVATIHRAPGSNIAADDCDTAGRRTGLPSAASVGAAGCRLSHHPGADLLPGRQSRGHHLSHYRASGKTAGPDRWPAAHVIDQFRRCIGHHTAV
jgi:multidrug efflux system membrane fusion protein